MTAAAIIPFCRISPTHRRQATKCGRKRLNTLGQALDDLLPFKYIEIGQCCGTTQGISGVRMPMEQGLVICIRRPKSLINRIGNNRGR